MPHLIWPRLHPGRANLAFVLLYGSRDAIDTAEHGPRDVPADTWTQRKDAWWYRLREDSMRSAKGEVLSLLTWPGGGQLDAARAFHGVWLPWEPGKGARKKLARCLQQKWEYRRGRGAVGEVTLETEVPSHQRLVLPAPEKLGARFFRRLVDDVARHKGVHRDKVLLSMLETPKWVRERREGLGILFPGTS